MIFAPGLQFITGRLLPLVLLNAVECERTSCEARNYCDEEEEEGKEEEREGGEKKLTKDRRWYELHCCHLRNRSSNVRVFVRVSVYAWHRSTDIRDKVFDAWIYESIRDSWISISSVLCYESLRSNRRDTFVPLRKTGTEDNYTDWRA